MGRDQERPAQMFRFRGSSIIHGPARRRGLYWSVQSPHFCEFDINSFQVAYTQHAFAFWLVLLGALLIAGFWIWRVQRHSRRLEARFNAVLRDAGEDNTARLLIEYLGTVRGTAQSVARMQEQHNDLVHVMPSVIRHVGLVRFSPFRDTGSDQSFALALLDGRGDGVVVTALHSRTDSRLYAKPIEHGASSYALTPEERAAMERAFAEAEDVPVSRRA